TRHVDAMEAAESFAGPFGSRPLSKSTKTNATPSKPSIITKVWSYEAIRDASSELRKLAHVGIGGVADKHAAVGDGSRAANWVAWNEASTDNPMAPPSDWRNCIR